MALEYFSNDPGVPSQRTIEGWKGTIRQTEREAKEAGRAPPPIVQEVGAFHTILPRNPDGTIDLEGVRKQRLEDGANLATAAHQVLVTFVNKLLNTDTLISAQNAGQLIGIIDRFNAANAAFLKEESEQPQQTPLQRYLEKLSTDQLKRLIAGETLEMEEMPD